MLASVDNRFVFIANPKCASSSVEAALRPWAHVILGNSAEWKHTSYQQIKALFGDYFASRDIPIYAVVRHPKEILWSWWRYRQRKEIIVESHPRFPYRTNEVSFLDWLAEWDSDTPPKRATFPSQKETLQNSEGTPGPINFFHVNELRHFADILSESLGHRLVFPRLNVSPVIDCVVSDKSFRSFSRYRDELSFYEQLQDCLVERESRGTVRRSVS